MRFYYVVIKLEICNQCTLCMASLSDTFWSVATIYEQAFRWICYIKWNMLRICMLSCSLNIFLIISLIFAWLSFLQSSQRNSVISLIHVRLREKVEVLRKIEESSGKMKLIICRDLINIFEVLILYEAKFDKLIFDYFKIKAQLSLILDSHLITTSNERY